jgi:hypothetical protein
MNPTVLASSVTSARELARIRKAENERAKEAAHKAALHVLDVIDAISGPVPPIGPRTGSHPMATPLPPAPRREPNAPMATRIQPPVPLHVMAENATPYITALGLACAFVAGLALGKAL